MIKFRHAKYKDKSVHWTKYRDVYCSGPEFRNRYLVKFSNRESEYDFTNRKNISYVPAFAKAAVDEVKNAIFQRIADVTRVGGPDSYQKAIQGDNLGVDLRGSSMNSFIGRKILPELLPMGKVGIMVGRSSAVGQTRNSPSTPPFLREYPCEDILSWSYRKSGSPWELETLLVQEEREVIDKESGLIDGSEKIYKYFYFNQNGEVECEERDDNDKPVRVISSRLTMIPFVILEITDSLLRDIADYQIALLNICSSDLNFILKGNVPFYVEQEDPRQTGNHLKRGGDTENEADGYLSEEQSSDDIIRVGAVDGRRYAKGLNQPDFIAPPTGPLQASMDKQEQMKNEIKQLINLTLADVKSISAESKKMDDRGLEAGLSYIGLELEHAERMIAKIWAMYEGGEEATVRYPERYSLKTDDEILEETEKLEERMAKIPSVTYKKEIAKEIAENLLGSKVDLKKLATIKNEIDKADMLTTDPEVIFRAIENAVLSNEVAARALGFPEGDVEKAKQDHADRASRIAEAQSKITDRGVDDLQNPTDGKDDKKIAEQRKDVES